MLNVTFCNQLQPFATLHLPRSTLTTSRALCYQYRGCHARKAVRRVHSGKRSCGICIPGLFEDYNMNVLPNVLHNCTLVFQRRFGFTLRTSQLNGKLSVSTSCMHRFTTSTLHLDRAPYRSPAPSYRPYGGCASCVCSDCRAE